MVELSDDGTRAMSDWTITLPINGPFAITDTVTLTFRDGDHGRLQRRDYG